MERSQLRNDKLALTLNEEETVKTAVIFPEVHTEWLIFHTLLAKKPEDSIALQLKELITNEMLVTMFPNLKKIASISVLSRAVRWEGGKDSPQKLAIPPPPPPPPNISKR